ncbi:MAG: hypothetical protein CMJ23_07580, partial [Phycisphaerae bacterium]|nr:hypothetical protein [Phycisphaerae bacterium]
MENDHAGPVSGVVPGRGGMIVRFTTPANVREVATGRSSRFQDFTGIVQIPIRNGDFFDLEITFAPAPAGVALF